MVLATAVEARFCPLTVMNEPGCMLVVPSAAFTRPVPSEAICGAGLPEGARDALVLHALYGYSHGEAAQMLGIAEGTCKAQLHRARALLRERLGVGVS